jgi:hypothetical protein
LRASGGGSAGYPAIGGGNSWAWIARKLADGFSRDFSAGMRENGFWSPETISRIEMNITDRLHIACFGLEMDLVLCEFFSGRNIHGRIFCQQGLIRKRRVYRDLPLPDASSDISEKPYQRRAIECFQLL